MGAPAIAEAMIRVPFARPPSRQSGSSPGRPALKSRPQRHAAEALVSGPDCCKCPCCAASHSH